VELRGAADKQRPADDHQRCEQCVQGTAEHSGALHLCAVLLAPRAGRVQAGCRQGMQAGFLYYLVWFAVRVASLHARFRMSLQYQNHHSALPSRS
jgi:hypothetical protein